MRSFILFPLLAGGLAAPAMAQDFPMFRVEATVGYDNLEGTVDYRDTAVPADNFSVSDNTDGAVFGAAVGVDVPVGPVYLGAEASVDFASNKRCSEVFGDDAACFKAKRSFALGGRIGIPAGKRVLVYAGGAWVNGKAEISYEDDLDPSNDFTLSDDRDGYRISGGLEYRWQKNVFVKLEYRYSDYEDYSYSEGTESISLGFTRQQVVAGIGARF